MKKYREIILGILVLMIFMSSVVPVFANTSGKDNNNEMIEEILEKPFDTVTDKEFKIICDFYFNEIGKLKISDGNIKYNVSDLEMIERQISNNDEISKLLYEFSNGSHKENVYSVKALPSKEYLKCFAGNFVLGPLYNVITKRDTQSIAEAIAMGFYNDAKAIILTALKEAGKKATAAGVVVYGVVDAMIAHESCRDLYWCVIV